LIYGNKDIRFKKPKREVDFMIGRSNERFKNQNDFHKHMVLSAASVEKNHQK
jgi:hypothetical protein